MHIYICADLHLCGFTPVQIYTCADLHRCGFTPVRIYTCVDLQATRKNLCAELQAMRIYTYRGKTPARFGIYTNGGCAGQAVTIHVSVEKR